MTVSIVTCVNDFEAYNANIRDGVYAPQTQLLPIFNTDNAMSAPQALNIGIDRATHAIVVCCHQDVRFPIGWVDALHEQIRQIGDPEFGVLGTFGVDMAGRYAGNIKDPHNNPKLGDLPCLAQTLDEHCLIIRKAERLRFDEELGGFHMYGADICLEAMCRGLKNYVIDARLEHLSGGKIDGAFTDTVDRFKEKWYFSGFRGRVKTTCCQLWIGETNVSV